MHRTCNALWTGSSNSPEGAGSLKGPVQVQGLSRRSVPPCQSFTACCLIWPMCPAGAVPHGRWWDATFHTVTAVVGVGVLSLPHAFSYLTWTGGIIALGTTTATSLYTAYLLAALHEEKDGRRCAHACPETGRAGIWGFPDWARDKCLPQCPLCLHAAFSRESSCETRSWHMQDRQ